jgi:hypothetical protein
MLRLLFFRFRRRRAVNTLIGGLIVLSLILTALVTMVFVSQQNDQYQQSVNKMVQYNGQRQSENLVFNSPGLTIVTSNASIPGWAVAGKCGGGGTYNCYSMTVSNLGGVNVQIVRIYINSTGSGCTSLCVLNATSTIAPYTFNQANSLLNQGEVNHALILALPDAVALPNPPNGYPMNTILVATNRGNVFSFQWPTQPQLTPSGAAFSSGLLKVAYQGTYDSKNEPGPVAGIPGVPGSGSGGNSGSGTTYCHKETLFNHAPGPGKVGQDGYPSNYAEKLTLGTYGTMYFVNPWVTEKILCSTDTTGACVSSAGTTMYIYTVVKNIFNTSITVSSGSIDLMWFSTNHLDGVLIGLYYQGRNAQAQFYPMSNLPIIEPGAVYYAIFQMNQMQLTYLYQTGHSGYPQSVMFWGGASISTTAENETYFSGSVLASGLWMRNSC